jgi:hypothetical protein
LLLGAKFRNQNPKVAWELLILLYKIELCCLNICINSSIKRRFHGWTCHGRLITQLPKLLKQGVLGVHSGGKLFVGFLISTGECLKPSHQEETLLCSRRTFGILDLYITGILTCSPL